MDMSGAHKGARAGGFAHRKGRSSNSNYNTTPHHTTPHLKARLGPGSTMAWALQELRLHQQAEREGVQRELLE